jgi:hypothetical protein
MPVNNDVTFTVVLTVTYSRTSTFDEEPEPVEIPDDMSGQLHNNIEYCISHANLLNDTNGVLEIENWNIGVLDGHAVEALRRGFNWASEHGWVDDEDGGDA